MDSFSAIDADIHTLYHSDFYRVLDFKCRCMDCRVSKPEYSNSFCISFVRKGNFLFNVFRQSLDSFTGCILVSKPEYERTVAHVHEVPDECTIFDFTHDFYQELLQRYSATKFFTDNDWHTALVRTNAETEFLHFTFMQRVQARSAGKLHIDQLVMEMIGRVLGAVTEQEPDVKLNARLKKNHLVTIERAKEYIAANFTRDISLMEIAVYCHVSLFHFSRIFKTFTSYSPHQFLLSIRLQHAKMLVENTVMPIADIGFSSGFNSVEHFTAAFHQKYKRPPSWLRKGNETGVR